MLHTHAPFPHPGSEAFLAPEGEAVRILEHDPRAGMTRLAFKPGAYPRTGPDIRVIASGNKRVPTRDLYADQLQAIARKARRARSRAKRTRRAA